MTLHKHSDRTVRKACHHCGRKDLYWAHDTEQPFYPNTTETHSVGDRVPRCEKCEVVGAFVMIEIDGSRHETGSTPATQPPSVPTPASMPPKKAEGSFPAPPATAPVKPAGDLAAALELLSGVLAPKLDPAEIEAIVKRELQNIAFPTHTVYQPVTGPAKEVTGETHARLSDVLLDLSIGENVLMVGPAGTGKSTIARQAAEALDAPYGEISLNPGLTATALLGYMNATGTYVSTVFRGVWEGGGVFHADEFDNGHPSTLATLNAALATAPGGSIAFPDGMIRRHDDFRFVASANTFGRGPDRVYVGRQQLDAATLDRFVVEEIHVDESLEHAACLATGYDSPKVSEVLRYVRQLRSNAHRAKMTLVFSPRASIGMCRLLNAGKPLKATIESRVRKGISDADWSKVTDGVSNPSV